MDYRDEIAKQHGLLTSAELLERSKPLPLPRAEGVQSYIAHHWDGTWFVWDDVPPRKESGE